MLKVLEKNRIKVLGSLMVVVALVSAMMAAVPEASASGGCSGCMFWNGGPVCLQPGQDACYYGTHLVCQCDVNGNNCGMAYLGTCQPELFRAPCEGGDTAEAQTPPELQSAKLVNDPGSSSGASHSPVARSDLRHGRAEALDIDANAVQFTIGGG